MDQVAFIALNNQTLMQHTCVEVQVPGGEPQSIDHRFELAPCPPPTKAIELTHASEDDVLSWLPRYLERTVVLWLMLHGTVVSRERPKFRLRFVMMMDWYLVLELFEPMSYPKKVDNIERDSTIATRSSLFRTRCSCVNELNFLEGTSALLMAGVCLAKEYRGSGMEAWDVVTWETVPALSVAAQASKDGASVLMMSSTAFGDAGLDAMDGIACHIQEESNRGHREDTIKMGSFLSDQDIVAEQTTKALRIVDLLSEEALIFDAMLKGLSKDTMPLDTLNHDSVMLEIRQLVRFSRFLKNNAHEAWCNSSRRSSPTGIGSYGLLRQRFNCY